MDSSITAYFGGDTSNLRQATQEASIMMKVFGREASMAVRDIGSGMIGAVAFLEIAKGIKDIAESEIAAAEQARNMGQALTDQQQAWLDIHDAVSDAGGGIKDFLGNVLSIPLVAGDAIGGLINDARGISPAMQAQYQQMSNDFSVNMAKMKAEHDKFVADLPAAQAKADSELKALSDKLSGDTLTGQAKLNNLYSSQATIINSINDTEQAIAATQASSLPSAQKELQLKADKLQLTKEQVALAQNELEIDATLLEMTKQEIADNTTNYEIRSKTETSEQQISDLKAQIAKYDAQAVNSSNTVAQQELYKAAAQKDGVQVAKVQDDYQKSISLSVSDQLAMFSYQVGVIKGVNAVSQDQYNLLTMQAQQKKNQVDIEQTLNAYKLTGSQTDKDSLATLMAKNDALTQQIGIQQTVIANDKADAAAIAAQVAEVNAKSDAEIMDAQDTEAANAVDADGNPIGGTTQGGVPGLTDHYDQIGQELNYVNDSMSNAKESIGSLIQNLSAQRNQLSDSPFDPTAPASVQALTAKIAALQAQYNNISPTNVTGAISTTPMLGSTQAQQTLLQSSSDSLSTIKTTLQQLVSPPK